MAIVLLSPDGRESCRLFAAVGGSGIDEVGDELATDGDHLVAPRHAGNQTMAGDARLLEDLGVVEVVGRAVFAGARAARRLPVVGRSLAVPGGVLPVAGSIVPPGTF